MSGLRQAAYYPRREPSWPVRAAMILIAFGFLIGYVVLMTLPAGAQLPVWECWKNVTTDSSPPRENCVPGLVGVTSVVSASGLVVRASPGLAMRISAANQTATAGFLVLLNQTTIPNDGAITPVDCIAMPASGGAVIDYSPGPGSVHSTGIVAVVTATSCFTKTSTVTSFIRGSALSWP